MVYKAKAPIRIETFDIVQGAEVLISPHILGGYSVILGGVRVGRIDSYTLNRYFKWEGT